MRITCLLAGLLLLLAGVSARAAVTMASLFTDHLVLQREQPVPVWGTADPGEAVTVSFNGQQVRATADAAGKWLVRLKAMPVNAAPQELTIAGAANTVTLKDVLVGEVWLCSGQSNMVWEVRSVLNAAEEIPKANYPLIRAFTAQSILPAGKYAPTPQERCLGAWQACTPDTVRNWSGVGYFFARMLHQRLNVPVGIIVAATGATCIESWNSLEGLKAIPQYRERACAYEEILQAYLKDPASLTQALADQAARLPERRQAWFAKLDAEDPGLKEKWMAPGMKTAKWDAIALPVTVADNPLGAPVASIWFRKEVEIPAEWAGKPLELRLGVLDAVDESYVNGVRVGRTWFDTPSYWTASRVYPVPAVDGTHVVVAMRLLKLAYHMAPFGPAAEMRLAPKDALDAQPVSLAGEWRLRKAQDLDAGLQPQLTPSGNAAPGSYYGHPGVQYNALIHPLIPYAIRGALWYQGEANAPFYIDYRSQLPGLIAAWRAEWGQGDFPFGIVQLASYFGEQTAPVERGGYINVRESQAMALAVPGAFMATAMDIGEGNNIHPRNKQEVGRRLALNALQVVYRQKDILGTGPVYKSMKVEGNTIRLRFTAAKGLYAKGDPPVGFAIAGADRTFYFAQAKIDGEEVVVWSDKVPNPVAVRYAWATNPVCNLYNAADMPIYPFHTDTWDLSQLVIPKDTVTLPTGWVTR